MARPSMLWRVIAAVFVVVNVGGAAYAAAMREPRHALLHLVVLAAGYIAWSMAPWQRRQAPVPAQLPDERLDYLQHSVDAVAIEVERLGEAQRYAEKLRTARGQATSPKKEE